MNSVEEKLAQFIGLKMASASYDPATRIAVIDFDDDGDPETEGTLMLTISDITLANIRVD